MYNASKLSKYYDFVDDVVTKLEADSERIYDKGLKSVRQGNTCVLLYHDSWLVCCQMMLKCCGRSCCPGV